MSSLSSLIPELIPVSSIPVSSHEYGKDFPFKFAAVKQLAEVTFVPAHHLLHILSGDMVQFFRRFWASGGKEGCAGSLRSGLSHHSGIGGRNRHSESVARTLLRHGMERPRERSVGGTPARDGLPWRCRFSDGATGHLKGLDRCLPEVLPHPIADKTSLHRL